MDAEFNSTVVIPRALFADVVFGMANPMPVVGNARMSHGCLVSIHHLTESYLIDLLNKAYLLSWNDTRESTFEQLISTVQIARGEKFEPLQPNFSCPPLSKVTDDMILLLAERARMEGAIDSTLCSHARKALILFLVHLSSEAMGVMEQRSGSVLRTGDLCEAAFRMDVRLPQTFWWMRNKYAKRL